MFVSGSSVRFPPDSVGIEYKVPDLSAAFCLRLPERGNQNISFLRVSRTESTTFLVYSHMLVPLRHDWPQFNHNLIYIQNSKDKVLFIQHKYFRYHISTCKLYSYSFLNFFYCAEMTPDSNLYS